MDPDRVKERVFFALWPGDATRSALHSLAESWCEACGGRATRRENLHVTLVFIGDVDARQFALLENIAARVSIEPFTLAIDRGGYFQHKRIAWAGPADAGTVLPDIVIALRQALTAAGIGFDARPHVPHVTLLRNAMRAPAPVIEPAVAWRIDALSLVRSRRLDRGLTYEVAARSSAGNRTKVF